MGNEEPIKIWEDKWILNLTTYAGQSLVSILEREARVKELIDEYDKRTKNLENTQ